VGHDGVIDDPAVICSHIVSLSRNSPCIGAGLRCYGARVRIALSISPLVYGRPRVRIS
jgi:hypothetical protein